MNPPSTSKNDPIDPAETPNPECIGVESWDEVLETTQAGLMAFLKNRLDQDSDIQDCIQVVAMRTMEFGQNVRPAARRAWLFKVAANEAALIGRRKSATQKMQDNISLETTQTSDPLGGLIQAETIAEINGLMLTLPEATQQVIRLKIEQNLTFQQIADQLNIPLGTALTRMRRGMEKLRGKLGEGNDE